MRYAFFILFILFIFNIEAKTISQFHQSKSLSTLIEFIQLSYEDQNIHLKIEDQKPVEKIQKCHQVGSLDAETEFSNLINNVLKFYPDEELPIREAKKDFQDFIGKSQLLKCVLEKADQGKKIIFYSNEEEKIYFYFEKVVY